MNRNLWARQIAAIARLELKRFIFARRWIGVYLVALGPVVLMLFFSRMAPGRREAVAMLSEVYANLFQGFILRFAIFMACAVVFSQSFRGDILEKTLHFYLLAPARREIIAIGKYAACVVLVASLFTVSTIASFILIYSSSSQFGSFFLEGPGISHLIRYVTVTVLASLAYGSVFLLVGLFFKNPGVPAVFLLGWESLNFALPPLLQKLSVVHYLLGLLPVAIDRGPFAIVIEAPSPIFGIPLLLLGAAALIALSAWMVRSTQITYSAD